MPTFALRWLYPRLRKFQAQYPLLRVVMQTRLNDMTSNDGDAGLGIRYGLGNWSADAPTQLYPEWILPVCAPGYAPTGTTADFDKATLAPRPAAIWPPRARSRCWGRSP